MNVSVQTLSPALEFAGKVILVTGAGRGIGAAIACAFGREGGTVVVNYNSSAAGAEAIVASIELKGGRAAALQADVTDGSSVAALIEQTLNRFGRIDALINNAGKLKVSPLDSMSDEMWDEMMSANLRSVFLMTRAVIPTMLGQGGGTIVNMSSSIAQKGISGLSHYAASKAGVIAFTKSIAREYGPRGIRANAVAAGPIDTDMLEHFPTTPDKISAHYALRRVGIPDDIAPTILFLAGSRSGYYTGQTFSPNGGDVMP